MYNYPTLTFKAGRCVCCGGLLIYGNINGICSDCYTFMEAAMSDSVKLQRSDTFVLVDGDKVLKMRERRHEQPVEHPMSSGYVDTSWGHTPHPQSIRRG